MNDDILRLEAVSKSYGAVRALDGVDLAVRRGTIHAILGENGAGKSTLLKILSGVVQRDGGRILLDGTEVAFPTPRDATRAGIVCVFQELSLIPHLTVAENVLLAEPPRGAFGRIDRRRQRAACLAILSRMGTVIDPDARVGDLPLARQQLVEIAKAMALSPRVLILDEATSALSAEDVRLLFDLLRRLKDQGTTILFISHRMHEIDAIADRASVFRNGRHIETFDAGTRTDDQRIEMMIGRAIAQVYPPKPPAPDGVPRLSLRGVNWGGRLHDINLDLRPGEILGLGGLDGQGQSELLLALFGVLKGVQGRIALDNVPYTPRTPASHNRATARIALIPEDRKTQGLFLPMSIRDNIAIAALSDLARGGVIDRGVERRRIGDLVARLQIKVSSLDLPVATMSGGNQQKVVLAKWLATGPRILLLNDPTRGVDVGTKQQIYVLLRELAAEGLGILFLSSDYDELIGLCDRVHILYGGRIHATLAGGTLTERNVIAASLGHAATQSQTLPHSGVSHG